MSGTTTTPATPTTDGLLRYVYGDTTNPLRVEVSISGKWTALQGVKTVVPLADLTGANPTVVRIELSDVTLMSATRAAMATTD